MPDSQTVPLPPLVVELPEDVVGREVVLDVVVRLEVVLPVLDGLADVEVDVDTAGVGAGGLELHAPRPATTIRVAAAASPVHTRPSLTSRIPST